MNYTGLLHLLREKWCPRQESYQTLKAPYLLAINDSGL
ncbi:hypothetical protein ABH909_005593 [Pseudomonas sp. BS3782 TE3695]